MSQEPEYGETWVYESIVGALPGIDLPAWAAIALQFVLFEFAAVATAWYYGLWRALVPATVVIAIAAVGSAEMLRIGTLARRAGVPTAYRRFLFGSNIEVVLAVLAYVALLTHLFVWDPRQTPPGLLTDALGPNPPVVAVYLLLLVLWDVCYRIGTGWWASVAALWRSARFRFDSETSALLRRADLETMGFGFVQLALLPFIMNRPVLVAVVVGHVVAVTLVTGLSVVLLRRRETDEATRL